MSSLLWCEQDVEGLIQSTLDLINLLLQDTPSKLLDASVLQKQTDQLCSEDNTKSILC